MALGRQATNGDDIGDVGPTARMVFWLHTALFTGINIVLFVINMLVDHTNPWFLYCLWGWGMVLALQGGLTYRWKGLLGAQGAFTIVLLVGLTAINVEFGGGPWVLWVYATFAIPLAAHILYVSGQLTLFNAHALASLLWFAEIMTAQLMFDTVWWTIATSTLSAGAGLVALLLVHHRYRDALPQTYVGA